MAGAGRLSGLLPGQRASPWQDSMVIR